VVVPDKVSCITGRNSLPFVVSLKQVFPLESVGVSASLSPPTSKIAVKSPSVQSLSVWLTEEWFFLDCSATPANGQRVLF